VKKTVARHLHYPVKRSRYKYDTLFAKQEVWMDNVKSIAQAYALAPWRKQFQMIAMVLLVLVMGASIASIYLTVSARAVAAGHDIQVTVEKIEEMNRASADLESQLAYLTSASTMKARAEELGYHPAEADQILYIEVPGYTGRQTPNLAPPPGPVVVNVTTISPAFTESLVDWFIDNVLKSANGVFTEVQPWK
jgi:ABC-type uncharacterized transport system fused permease/ATPase subunit